MRSSLRIGANVQVTLKDYTRPVLPAIAHLDHRAHEGFTGIVARVTPEYDRVEPDAPASSIDLDGLAGRERELVNAVIDNDRLFAALLDSNVGELLAR